MLQLAWKNIQFRKMRAILTALGIATSVMLVVFMNSIMTATEQSLIDSFGRMGGQIRVQAKSSALDGQSLDIVPTGIFLSTADSEQVLKSATGYNQAESSPVISQMILPPIGPNQPPELVINGVAPGREQAILLGAAVTSGAAKLQGDRDVILGATALKNLIKKAGHDLAVGDKVTLPGAGEFTIRGIAKKSDPMTDGVAIVPLATAQQIFKRGDTVNYVALSYKVDQVKSAAAALKPKLADMEVVTPDAMLEAADKALSGQRSFFKMINSTVYLTAIMMIFMVMHTAVMERTKEIGTMRALGAPRSAIVGAVVAEAALFAVAGAALGALAGSFIMRGWGLLNMVQFLLVVGQTGAATVVIAALSSLYPAIRAARINPLEALRYE
jgi:putative ABC transport system permease protein